jgi:hypothetical protein
MDSNNKPFTSTPIAARLLRIAPFLTDAAAVATFWQTPDAVARSEFLEFDQNLFIRQMAFMVDRSI